ncbi:MAG: hypothetical protein Q4C05_01840 [Akkermansia sp.]|nr:hypothetical protein [Akkermansia sp.]
MQTEIECKPTGWFIGRAVMMMLMFLGFGGYFYYDGSVGYAEKNLEMLMYRCFVKAGETFDKEVNSGHADSMTWREIVKNARVDFPAEYPLPEGVDRENTPWPEVLADYELMKAAGKGWSSAWEMYSAEKKFALEQDPEAHPYDESKVFEQWVAGTVCIVLGTMALYVLIRTLGRKMQIKGSDVQAAGQSFQVKDVCRLDMRQWKLKGLAYAQLSEECGGKKVRLDGLTYGGFKEENAPNNAEGFMQAFLAQYSGEIVDYADEEPTAQEQAES